MKKFYVLNSRGEREPFLVKKVYRGVCKSGVNKEIAKKITKIIQKKAFPGISTSKIAKRIKELLLKESPRAALKFNLKEGMLKLGPTGFPFEKYIGEVFSDLGYTVKLNLRPRGVCGVLYEIDFLAKKDKIFYLGECKYHQKAGGRVDLGIALVNYARFLDLKKSSLFKKNKNSKVKTIIVTNTKFTSQAIKYSEYQGVSLLGWKYPKERGLETLIEKKSLYPITILPSLKPELKDIFIKAGKILVRDILKIDPQKFSRKYKIPLWKLQKLIKEADILLN